MAAARCPARPAGTRSARRIWPRRREAGGGYAACIRARGTASASPSATSARAVVWGRGAHRPRRRQDRVPVTPTVTVRLGGVPRDARDSAGISRAEARPASEREGREHVLRDHRLVDLAVVLGGSAGRVVYGQRGLVVVCLNDTHVAGHPRQHPVAVLLLGILDRLLVDLAGPLARDVGDQNTGKAQVPAEQ